MTPGGKHSHNYNHHNHPHYYHHCYSIKNSTHKNALAAIQPVTSAVVYTCTLDETGVHARRIGQHPEGGCWVVNGTNWQQAPQALPHTGPAASPRLAGPSMGAAAVQHPELRPSSTYDHP